MLNNLLKNNKTYGNRREKNCTNKRGRRSRRRISGLASYSRRDGYRLDTWHSKNTLKINTLKILLLTYKVLPDGLQRSRGRKPSIKRLPPALDPFLTSLYIKHSLKNCVKIKEKILPGEVRSSSRRRRSPSDYVNAKFLHKKTSLSHFASFFRTRLNTPFANRKAIPIKRPPAKEQITHIQKYSKKQFSDGILTCYLIFYRDSRTQFARWL